MPPKSKSGTIRSAIGLTVSRLKKCHTESKAMLLTTPSNPQQYGKEIDVMASKLETSIASLVEKDEKWQELIQGLEDDEMDAEESLYNITAYATADSYASLIEDAKETLGLLQVKRKQCTPTVAVASSASTVTPKPEKVTTAKLPKLQLPIFEGDYLEWDRFWSIFNTNVHQSSLTGTEKFAYLEAQIQGPARDTIKGVAINDNNYETAVALLKTRYERCPEHMICSYYSQLMRLPASTVKVADMLRTYDACERIFRQLEKAGEDMETNRSSVLQLFSKFPNSVVKDLFNQFEVDSTSKLSQLRTALGKYIRRSENLGEIFDDLEPYGGQRSKDRQRAEAEGISNAKVVTSKINVQTSTFGAAESKQSSRSNTTNYSSRSNTTAKNIPQNPCYFCSGDHFNSQCPEYTTAIRRIERMVALGKCVRCMSSNHLVADCRTSPQRIWCFFCQTNGSHPSALCKQMFKSPESMSKSSTTTAINEVCQPANPSTLLNSEERSLLLTAVTTVINRQSGDKAKMRLLLDTGSHRSYITKGCTDSLALQSKSSESLNVAVFGTERTLSVNTSQVSFNVVLANGSSIQITANTTPIITSGHVIADRLPKEAIRYVESMGYTLADDYTSNEGNIDILIGSDYLWEFITGTRMSIPGGLYLIPSSLGFLLGGRYCDDESSDAQPVLLCLTDVSHSKALLHDSTLAVCENSVCTDYPDIDNYWALEKIGIADNPIEIDDDKALKQFNDTVRFNVGRYEVCWPWRDNKCQLPTNYGLAYGRLVSALKRFKSGDPSMFQKYQHIIDDQVKKGVVEVVADESSNHPVHYLPHHPVVKPGSNTTKVRIVYDASSKSRRGELSLNECLYRGPVLLPDLCGILIRFRMDKIAVIADIEKAYLQIALQSSERDVTRFLWLKDPSNPNPCDNISIYRFCRVPFGVNSSAFLLGGTIKFHLNQVNSCTASLISKNMYVDNVFGVVSDEQSAVQFYTESKHIFNQAGMNLQEWSSNSLSLIQSIPDCDKGKTGEVKALGMMWNTDEDTLSLQNDWVSRAQCTTKRQVMQATASVFDPLGLYQPCTLEAKCFLRKLWMNNLSWDEKLDESLQKEWSRIHANIVPMFNTRIHRLVSKSRESTIVAFCDASINAYATAVYLRTPSNTDSNGWVSKLILAKSRVTPAKLLGENVSLPRLELLGLVIGSRAAKFVRATLHGSSDSIKIYILTDSTCVLHWLQSAKPLSTFVANRINEIRALDDVEFHHVASADNPADIGTRGITGAELDSCSLWWKGPDWLTLEVDQWPAISAVQSVSDEDLKLIESEHKKNPVFHTTVARDAALPNPNPPFGIDTARYSSFKKILRITAWCIKFISKLDPGQVGLFWRLEDDARQPFVTTDERYHAKKLWIQYLQTTTFDEVFMALKLKKPHQLCHQLNIICDRDGILRSCSRFLHADLPIESAQPMLLPKDHGITRMVIEEAHKQVFHDGVAHTLAQIRREYWIPQGRNAVRKVLNKCVHCRQLKGHPYQLPPMPPWPKERLARSSPYRYTGLDYLGPINIKVNDVVQKMWVALFTCLAVRAVHLEWVSHCSAQSFVDCMIRFTARRGFPEQIISDNDAQFRTANEIFQKTLHNILSDEPVTSYMAESGIRWKFITALAPWQGGFYERLVGVVKQAFRSVVGRRLLTLNQFTTVIAEVEAIVNSRPLTYVYEDPKSGAVLRPIDFITDLPVGRLVLDPSIVPTGGDACKNLIRYWKYHERRLDALWRVWYDEYLLSLRERGTINHRGGRKDVRGCPKMDEVVVVKEADAPRGVWKLAKVVRLIKSSDGAVRSIEVQLPNRVIIRRSVHHLYPLEVGAATTVANEDDSTGPPMENAETTGDDTFEGFDPVEVDEAQHRIRMLQQLRTDQSSVAISASYNISSGLSDKFPSIIQ